jgi:transcriptional regulator with PAS, ATPase and Fis domain
VHKKLLVFTESESFLEFYREAASAAGLELEVRRDLNEAGSSALVVVSAPGQEEQAADRVRDAAAVTPVPPIVVGSSPGHRLAMELIHAGADYYFVLPGEAGDLKDYVHERGVAMRGREELAAAEQRDFDFSRLVGESRAVKEALAVAARIIPRGSATVLLTGETGTGKELLAQAIHYNGPRKENPFVELNCSAIPANLLESELFGHERGAFTDARRAKPGLFEVAHGGTLFLDEIGELPFELQGKLLKVLEDKRVRRVGGTRSQEVDIRIIAATNRDLAAEVAEGSFREDLYYRLSVIPIHLPALRERGDDILLLAEHFIDALSQAYDIPRPELSRDLKDRLLTHSWPGNVRELRNSIERALLLSEEGKLRSEDLFMETSAKATSMGGGVIPFPAPMEAIELAAVRAMLERTGGNKSAAARRLAISRSRLHRALQRIAEIDARA